MKPRTNYVSSDRGSALAWHKVSARHEAIWNDF